MPTSLDVRGLTVELPTPSGWVRPVNDVSFTLARGETLGIVGESGSGKTMLSLALMGLEPHGGRHQGEAWLHPRNPSANGQGNGSSGAAKRAVNADAISSDGPRKNLLALSPEKMREVRGREIAMIFQEPMTALNPVVRIGAQIEEAIRVHEPRAAAQRNSPPRSRRHRTRRAVRPRAPRAPISPPAFRRPAPTRDDRHGPRGRPRRPHRRRAHHRPRRHRAKANPRAPRKIAPATSSSPCFSSPTISESSRKSPIASPSCTPDASSKKVQSRKSCKRPRHPYTQALLRAAPRLAREKLVPIPGTVPSLDALPPGCAFAPRCPQHVPLCDAAVPELRAVNTNHHARCILVP